MLAGTVAARRLEQNLGHGCPRSYFTAFPFASAVGYLSAFLAIFTTWDALEWIEAVGASFALITRDGRVIATSAEAGPNQPALHRAQVAATESELGPAIVRQLLSTKVEGQLAVLRRGVSTEQRAATTVEDALEELRTAQSLDSMLALEAKAASAYWGAWREVPIRFAHADEG